MIHHADRYSLAVSGLHMAEAAPRSPAAMARRLVEAVRMAGTVDRESLIRACRDYGYSERTAMSILRHASPHLRFDGAEYHPR